MTSNDGAVPTATGVLYSAREMTLMASREGVIPGATTVPLCFLARKSGKLINLSAAPPPARNHLRRDSSNLVEHGCSEALAELGENFSEVSETRMARSNEAGEACTATRDCKRYLLGY